MLRFTRNSRLCHLLWAWVERYMTTFGLMLWAKDNGQAPTPPTPQQIMDAQLLGNRAQAGLDTQYNRWLEDTPFGSVGWEQGFNQQQFNADKAERDRQYETLRAKREPVMRGQFKAAQDKWGGVYDRKVKNAEKVYNRRFRNGKTTGTFQEFLDKKGLSSRDDFLNQKSAQNYEQFSGYKLNKFLEKNPNKITPDVKLGDSKYQTFTRKTQLSPELRSLLANQLKGQNEAMSQGLDSLSRQRGVLDAPMERFKSLDIPTADLASRQRVEDSLMGRLNPYLDRDRQAMQAQLANQGLVPGTEAYTRAMDDINRKSNDARLAVIGAGGDEMARQYGMQMQGFQGGLQQNNQLFGQDLARRNQALGETQKLFGLSGNVPMPQSNSGAVGSNGGTDAGGAMNNQFNALLGQYNSGVAANNATNNAAMGAGAGLLGALINGVASYASS